MEYVKGYEGLYSVTSCGKVWSHKRQKFLKPKIEKNGYLRVCLRKDGKQRSMSVHRLADTAYIDNPDNLETVDHIDNNRQNNCINNLRWMTAMDNLDRGSKGRIKIRCIETNEVFSSLTDCARKTGCSIGNISEHLRGKQEHVKGLHFIKI